MADMELNPMEDTENDELPVDKRKIVLTVYIKFDE